MALPAWMEFAISVLLMDLAFYYWHLANHRVPLLWRFHNVHHIDPGLDVSTALRFHFGEITLFSVVQVSLSAFHRGRLRFTRSFSKPRCFSTTATSVCRLALNGC